MTPGVDQLFPSFPGFEGRGVGKPSVLSQTCLVAGFDNGGARNIMSVYVSEIYKRVGVTYQHQVIQCNINFPSYKFLCICVKLQILPNECLSVSSKLSLM